MRPGLRPLIWLGGSRKDLKTLPAEVQDAFGYALYLAQALHAFQKKSKSGIATPKPDIELIKRRLKDAAALQRKAPSG